MTFLTWSTKESVIVNVFSSDSLSFGGRSVSLSTFDFSWDSASVPCLPIPVLLMPPHPCRYRWLDLSAALLIFLLILFCFVVQQTFVSRTMTVSFSPNMLRKRFLTDNLGHTFLIDTRIREPLSAQKNLENHNLTGDLVFKFSVLLQPYI